MKKFLVILLAVVMVFTFVTVAACKKEAETVRVKLYVTENGEPIYRNHTVGQDDLPAVTNGGLTFEGWYYDKAFNMPYKYTDTEIENGASLYAKWNGGSQTTDKVTLTLNPNYTGGVNTTYELNKNNTFNLPTITRTGYNFVGWFTQAVDGIQWTNSMPISANTTLYAHWTAIGGGNQGGGDNPTPTPADLSAVFSKYTDVSKWNFAATVDVSYDGEAWTDYYEYLAYDMLYRYDYDGVTYTDYFGYDENDAYCYYSDDGDGAYTKYGEDSNEFETYYYLALVDLSALSGYEFSQSGSAYSAISPSSAGNAIFGEYDDATWTTVTLYIANNNVSKLVGVMSDGYSVTFTFSKFGQVKFTLPEATEGGSSGGEGDELPTEPTGTMENQVYDATNFDDDTLQDKLTTTGQYADPYIGLPSNGNYTALVIPVKFSNTTISQEQLNNLNIAFNGTSEQTGWESVQSYYYKSSYGALNLSFDIAGYNIDRVNYYTSSNEYSYYEGLTGSYQGQTYNNGDNVLLHEVLAYYESRLDLTKYDYNGDGAIDAVYLIYSAPVDYSDDSFYWAYVTWDSEDETKYDGKDAYYYLFAGFDFMNEKVPGKDTQGYTTISGLKINAETFIHETGHLLGLDDYYDYEESMGSNQGLGGADMMDFNVGDHGVYSKIMLGWLTPEIITSTQTVTIKSSQSQEEGANIVILIPLNWNNSYFCEYLLIDLYTNTGLNAMSASQENSILYGGAEYGVRIYHVTAWANDPYNNSYQSFTDYNNSVSNIPLIKLIEADGQTSTSSTDDGGWASEDDLWQTGDSFSNVFPQYMRNDGKLLNFNITIDSVSAEEATITITYNTTEAA